MDEMLLCKLIAVSTTIKVYSRKQCEILKEATYVTGNW
jgi:hypothetical protein